MPDYASGFMNMLQNGPGPLDPKTEAEIARWLEHKRQVYNRAAPDDPRAAQWLENDKARYTQHANELAMHAGAAQAVDRGKTMLIGLLGLSSHANKPGMPDRKTGRQDLGLQPWTTSPLQ